MLLPREESYYQHRITGERMSVARFNFKCSYDEMDQWDHFHPDGTPVLPTTSQDARKIVRFLRKYFGK